MQRALHRVGQQPGVRGDLSGVSGDLTGVRGDVDLCGLTADDRTRGVHVADLLSKETASEGDETTS